MRIFSFVPRKPKKDPPEDRYGEVLRDCQSLKPHPEPHEHRYEWLEIDPGLFCWCCVCGEVLDERI